jgi:hypothetical protein
MNPFKSSVVDNDEESASVRTCPSKNESFSSGAGLVRRSRADERTISLVGAACDEWLARRIPVKPLPRKLMLIMKLPGWMRNFRITKTGCWEWQGFRDNGYPIYGQLRVHREMLRKVRGELPEYLFACHHCDNPPCINPAHLFAGTHQDNMIDCAKKGRHWKMVMSVRRIQAGIPIVNRRADEKKARKAIECARVASLRTTAFALRETGMTQAEIAKRMGFCQPHVARMLKKGRPCG